MVPEWLHALSIASLAVAFGCTVLIAADEMRDPQRMWIMNVVWPATALFGSVLALVGYVAYGRPASKSRIRRATERGEDMPSMTRTPFPVMVAKGTCHCGSGCTLGDICAEWLAFAVPAVAVWFGWQSIFADKIGVERLTIVEGDPFAQLELDGRVVDLLPALRKLS